MSDGCAISSHPLYNFQIFQACIDFAVRHWNIKLGIWMFILLDNNAFLDALLGSPNYNINNPLIIRFKNIIKK
jgi:hypothetical protein